MGELEQKIATLTAIIEKSMENGEKESIKKQLADMQEEIKKMAISEEDKAKLEKTAELEEQITKMADTIDKLMKGNVNTDNQDNFAKEEKELNTYLKTGEMGETVKKVFNTTAGGALIPKPRQHEIIKQIMETSPVLRMAKRYSISVGSELTIPVKNRGTNQTAVQAEGATRGTARDLQFSTIKLEVEKLTTYTTVTSEMIDDSDFNVVAEVNETAKEDIAEYLSKNVWYGETSKKIVGIYKDSTVTGAAVEVATAKTMTWEDLKNLIYSLQPSVRARSSFIVSTAALSAMRGFKDANDRPLYVEPLTAGEPGVFMGYKVYEDVYMQDMDASSTDKYPVFFGDMSKFYAWLDRKGMYMEKDRNAGNDTYDFYTRIRIGGKVRDKEQGKLLKLKNA